jgi:hypothetical protein
MHHSCVFCVSTFLSRSLFLTHTLTAYAIVFSLAPYAQIRNMALRLSVWQQLVTQFAYDDAQELSHTQPPFSLTYTHITELPLSLSLVHTRNGTE